MTIDSVGWDDDEINWFPILWGGFLFPNFKVKVELEFSEVIPGFNLD